MENSQGVPVATKDVSLRVNVPYTAKESGECR
jgi:hypothetical protein